jgi:TonB family protein
MSLSAANSKPVLISLAKPDYPQKARTANLSGDVQVLVSVKPDGSIASVNVLSGHPMLKQAALDSAQHSTFECNGCTGDSVYSIVYRFEQAAEGDCCTASSVAPTVTQQTMQDDDQGRPQARISIIAEHGCLCDPTFTITRRRSRSLKCLFLWNCSLQ